LACRGRFEDILPYTNKRWLMNDVVDLGVRIALLQPAIGKDVASIVRLLEEDENGSFAAFMTEVATGSRARAPAQGPSTHGAAVRSAAMMPPRPVSDPDDRPADPGNRAADPDDLPVDPDDGAGLAGNAAPVQPKDPRSSHRYSTEWYNDILNQCVALGKELAERFVTSSEEPSYILTMLSFLHFFFSLAALPRLH
jgi:hypothetical protein